MIRVLTLIGRRADLSRESFRDHYESVHAPLSMALLEGATHYVRDHVAGTLGRTEPFFDVLSEFGYPDESVMQAMMKRLASQEIGDPIRADELRFMDKPRNVYFGLVGIAQHAQLSRGVATKVVLLARAPERSDRASFIAEHARAIAALPRTSSASTFECVNGPDGARAPYDAVSFLRYPEDGNDADSIHESIALDEDDLLLRIDERVTRVSSMWECGDD